jgi:hypothetical protein
VERMGESVGLTLRPAWECRDGRGGVWEWMRIGDGFGGLVKTQYEIV